MLLITGLLVAGVAGLASSTQAGATEVKGLSDQDMAGANAAPPVYSVTETRKWDKAYRQQPPLVPHQVAKYEIDLKVNQCVSCHDWKFAAKEKAPQLPESHYKDRDGNQHEEVYRGRWFCVTCHTPQTDAKPLVDNTFGGR
jgi:cytochrome c-type protein NapB